MPAEFPDRTPPAWVDAVEVGERDGQELTVLRYPDGTTALRHVCDRSKGERPDVEPTVVIQAPALDLHEVTWPTGGQPTIDPSIRCPDCSLHGHVVAGVWKPAADDGKLPEDAAPS